MESGAKNNVIYVTGPLIISPNLGAVQKEDQNFSKDLI
jgi:hypothetical protein